MNRRFGTPSPALIISLVALFAALGGTGYAATNQDSAVAAKKSKTLTKRQVNKLIAAYIKTHPPRAGSQGSTGPAGTNGQAGGNGTTGKDGTNGNTGLTGPGGSTGYSATIIGLNTTTGTDLYAPPIGFGGTSASTANTSIISPNTPLTVTDFYVGLTNSPGVNSFRSISLAINGTPVPTAGCVILSNSNGCEVGISAPIPPHSSIALQTSVFGQNNAQPGNAYVSITVK